MHCGGFDLHLTNANDVEYFFFIYLVAICVSILPVF